MTQFDGFPQNAFTFLAELAENNEKAWFEANKSRYEQSVLEPAKGFITAVGNQLESLTPNIRYDTRTNGSGSLMRIYRDTRFSKDKTPYKTNISGMWWEGDGKKTVSPAYGFQMNTEGMGLMAGLFGFDKGQLAQFREAVDSDKGSSLQAAIDTITSSEKYEVLGDKYKKVPREYDAAHPHAELLKFKGLYVHPLQPVTPEQLMTAEAVDICMAHFRVMSPIEHWLAEALL